VTQKWATGLKGSWRTGTKQINTTQILYNLTHLRRHKLINFLNGRIKCFPCLLLTSNQILQYFNSNESFTWKKLERQMPSSSQTMSGRRKDMNQTAANPMYFVCVAYIIACNYWN